MQLRSKEPGNVLLCDEHQLPESRIGLFILLSSWRDSSFNFERSWKVGTLCRIRRQILYVGIRALSRRAHKCKLLTLTLKKKRKKKEEYKFHPRLRQSKLFFSLRVRSTNKFALRQILPFSLSHSPSLPFSQTYSACPIFSTLNFVLISYSVRGHCSFNAIRVYRVRQTKRDTSSRLFDRSIRLASNLLLAMTIGRNTTACFSYFIKPYLLVQKFNVLLTINQFCNIFQEPQKKMLTMLQTKNNTKEIHFYMSDSKSKLNNNFILICDYICNNIENNLSSNLDT